MKENEEILNTNIDTDIDEFKTESYSYINKTFTTLNSKKYPSSYNQPSDYITIWPLLKSTDFHSRASQFTKHISPMTREGYTLPKLQKWWDAICSDLCQYLSTNKELSTIQETQNRT